MLDKINNKERYIATLPPMSFISPSKIDRLLALDIYIYILKKQKGRRDEFKEFASC